MWGTAFAFSYDGTISFLTAKHVVNAVDEQTGISVVTSFQRFPADPRALAKPR